MAELSEAALPILMIATAVAVVWTIIKCQTAYAALMESLPPQFQDGLSSKFAFPEYVLRPSTPLLLQAEYVKSQIGSCFAALGISLLFFLSEKLSRGFDCADRVFRFHSSHDQILEGIPVKLQAVA